MVSMRLLLLFACSCAAIDDNLRVILEGHTFKERVSFNTTNFACAPADTSNDVNIMCAKETFGTLGLLQSDEDGLIIRQASPEYARHIVVYDDRHGSDGILAYFFFIICTPVKCILAASAVVSCTFLVYSEKAVLVDFVSKITNISRCLQYNLTSNFTGIMAQLVDCTVKLETLDTVRNAKLRFTVPSINKSNLVDVFTVIDPSTALTPDSWDVVTVILIAFFAICLAAVLFILWRVCWRRRNRFTSVAKATDQADVSESELVGTSVENTDEVLSHDLETESGEVTYDFREDPDSENEEIDLGTVNQGDSSQEVLVSVRTAGNTPYVIVRYTAVTPKKEKTEARINELPVDDVDNVTSEDQDIKFQ